MRNADDVFLGEGDCRNWLGVDRIEERVCCGGRRMKYALVKCAKYGVVLASTVCIAACKREVNEESKV
jgi:hypothetical protein